MRGSPGLLGLTLSIGAAIALLTACGSSIGDSGPQVLTAARIDSTDCSAGAQAASDLRPVLRQLDDSLTALGPVFEHRDLPGALAQLDSAWLSADRISGRLDTAADAMTPASPIQIEYRNASESGTHLRDRLTEVRGALAAGQSQIDQSPRLQPAVTAFYGSVQRLSPACSNHFSASTADTTTGPTARPTR